MASARDDCKAIDPPTRRPVAVDKPQDAASVQTFLEKHPWVKYIRLHWVDLSGVMRTRIIPKERGLQMAQGKGRYVLAQNCMIVPILPAPQCFAEGPEAWDLHPHWPSLRLCGHHIKHAMVMCFTERKGAANGFARCPRRLLLDVLNRQPQDVNFMMGFEIEFVLLNEDLEISKPFDGLAGYSMLAGLRGKTLDIVEEIIEALEASGISIYHVHTEATDQLEIALSPEAPMQAIDELMYAQETIKGVFMRHGVKATLSPRPVFQSSPQNGVHVHLSSTKEGILLSILAGALRKMEALCAFGMANVDSYVRVIGDGAGLWIGYGTENRDLPIRRIDDDHFEFRFADATANMYLFVAVLLSAGLEGTQKAEPLTWKDCPVLLNPDSRGLDAYGIVERMPESLRTTLDAVKADEDVRKWIGEEMMYQYLSLKEHEIEFSKKMTDGARREKFLTFF